MAKFGGIIAGALGGGAQAVGQIAEGQIQNNQRLDLAREMSTIDEQKQLRIAQANETMRRDANAYDTTGQGGTNKLDFQARSTAQNNTADVKKASDMIPVEAERAGAVTKATNTAATAATIENGANPAFLSAVRALESAKESSGTRASAALASAEAQLKGEQLRDFKDLRVEYDAVKLLQNDTALTDVERAAKIAQHQQNIDLIKQKNAGGKSAQDINGVAANAGNLIKLAEAADLAGDSAKAALLRRQAEEMSVGAGQKKLPGMAATSTGVKPPPETGAVVNGYKFNGGDPANKANWSKADSAPKSASTTPSTEKPVVVAEETPADSPSGKYQARQAKLKADADEKTAKKKEWQATQAQRATEALGALDLNDPAAAQKFQESDLFDSLSTKQKAQVAKAVNGR